MKKYTEDAQKVLDELATEEIKQLQWDNPFRLERNAKIKELCDRGVKRTVIAQISGASKTSVSRIALQKAAF